MANLYKGYSVEFYKFWNYYQANTRVDHSGYSEMFNNCFMYEMSKAGFSQGHYSNTINLVEKKLNTLCQKTRTDMLSNGVPAAATKHIIDHFKKWFKSYYGD